MCGIAGLLSFDGRFGPQDVEAVLRMLEVQTHRGPDDWGLLLPDSTYANVEVRRILQEKCFLAEHKGEAAEIANRNSHIQFYKAAADHPAIILGNRRLSILDLSARGRMPMCNASGTVWLTHNGEIYNCLELRQELANDFRFHSNSDTEVLIHGYEKWGDNILDRLRGMFAFALFDTLRGRLLLARDRFGIKPLYYSLIEDSAGICSVVPGAVDANCLPLLQNIKSQREQSKLVFASEVRPILKSGLARFASEPEAVVRFLQLGSVPSPLTTVKNVFALRAGHSLLSEGSSIRFGRYWDLSPSKPGSKEENRARAIDETRRLLAESVRQHLLSDVPLGIFLSGGIDSSALVALARRFHEGKLSTLSIVFDEPEYNEAKYAQLVAKHYHTNHHETLLHGSDVLSLLPDVFAAMDQPTVDGVNSFFIARAAKQAGLKVVLSGLGGDEVFLGYQYLRRADRLNNPRQLFQIVPKPLRNLLVRLAKSSGSLLERSGVEKLDYLGDPSAANLYLLFRGLFTPRQIQRLLGIGDAEMKSYAALPQSIDGVATDSLVDSFAINDFQHYLQNQLLKDTDCMSMAHSIEARVPFLDHELVRYVFALPTRFKIAPKLNKPLLISAVGNGFPREIWDRPKMGFTFPFAVWLRDGLQTSQPNGSTNQPFDKAESEKIWQGFREERFHWSRPWALKVLENSTYT